MTYENYLKYKLVLTLLHDEKTVHQLVKETKFKQTTVYKMIRQLLARNEIQVIRYETGRRGWKTDNRTRVFIVNE